MSRDEVLQRLKNIEKEELGEARHPLGSNRIKYNTWYYGRVVHGRDYAWCAVFQCWSFQKAGISTAIFF
jgi:hypothetical protein